MRTAALLLALAALAVAGAEAALAHADPGGQCVRVDGPVLCSPCGHAAELPAAVRSVHHHGPCR